MQQERGREERGREGGNAHERDAQGRGRGVGGAWAGPHPPGRQSRVSASCSSLGNPRGRMKSCTSTAHSWVSCWPSARCSHRRSVTSSVPPRVRPAACRTERMPSMRSRPSGAVLGSARKVGGGRSGAR